MRLADGSTKVQSIVIRKTYEGVTDQLPEWVHQRLIIALGHDIVRVEGLRYFGNVSLESDYDIEWEEFMDKPIAPAKFKVQVTPFDATNANCQSCEEATQVALVDDVFDEALEENQEYTLNLFANDTIECQPFARSIIYYNSAYIASAELAEDGTLTIQTTEEFASANGLKILTYRVSCPNGGFDEADVYANFEGGIEACLAPTNIQITDVEQTTGTVSWNAPTPAPDEGYEWQVVRQDNPGLALWASTTSSTSVNLEDLSPGIAYIFSVRGKCSDDFKSPFVNSEFTTPAVPQTCGRYRILLTAFGLHPDLIPKFATYMDCGGEIQRVTIIPNVPKVVCAMESAPGVPVYLTGFGTKTYLEPCE